MQRLVVGENCSVGRAPVCLERSTNLQPACSFDRHFVPGKLPPDGLMGWAATPAPVMQSCKELMRVAAVCILPPVEEQELLACWRRREAQVCAAWKSRSSCVRSNASANKADMRRTKKCNGNICKMHLVTRCNSQSRRMSRRCNYLLARRTHLRTTHPLIQ